MNSIVTLFATLVICSACGHSGGSSVSSGKSHSPDVSIEKTSAAGLKVLVLKKVMAVSAQGLAILECKNCDQSQDRILQLVLHRRQSQGWISTPISFTSTISITITIRRFTPGWA